MSAMVQALRASRNLLEVTVAALCLWAAAYHTPVGALARMTVAAVFGSHSSGGNLLSYYTGTSYAHPGGFDGAHLPEVRDERALTAEEALGYGVYGALERCTAPQREEAQKLVAQWGGAPVRWSDADRAPFELARAIQTSRGRFGSEELAVAALFVGDEPARYARDRMEAERLELTVANAARELPPGFEDRLMRAAQALSLGTAYGLGWPVSPRVPITSPFGLRDHPLLGIRQNHTGVDLGVPEGTPVAVVASGVVVRASEDGVNGRLVVVDHGRGVSTAYCHNSKLLVATGDKVVRGQQISLSGNTGRSTGAHLHYQLELSDAPVDPLLFRKRPTAVARDRPSD